MDVSGLPPMLPSQMSQLLDAEAGASSLFGSDDGFAGAVSLSEALSPQEQVELSSLQSAESNVGMLSGSTAALSSPAAFLDLSIAAQEQLLQPATSSTPPRAFDPTQDPANPFYGADPAGSWYADDPVDPSWATDPANPDFYA